MHFLGYSTTKLTKHIVNSQSLAITLQCKTLQSLLQKDRVEFVDSNIDAFSVVWLIIAQGFHSIIRASFDGYKIGGVTGVQAVVNRDLDNNKR